MAGSFTAVDLSRLQAPDIVEQISYEDILASMLADLQARDDVFTALVESDPAYKILEVAAYRETLLRQRVNEAANGVMLAFAVGVDLDQIAAKFNVVRLVIDPGDPDALPPVLPVYENDTDFRRRVQLAFEGMSTAGPRGAYYFHALSAHADVLDASVTSPNPGDVIVTVLSRIGNGVPAGPVLDAVDARLSDEDVRPLTDNVTVQSASIVNFTVSASLTIYPGPDAAVVLAASQSALLAYIEANHRIGRDVTLSGLYHALHQEGVQNVTLTAPVASIAISETQASYCTGTTVVIGGVDE